MGRGINVHPSVLRNIRFVFSGADSSRIMGEGNYSTLGNVKVLKVDSVWNTINKSASFSSAFSTAVTTIPEVNFDLFAGMYIHDVDADITLSTNGDGDVFLGDLVGLVVRDGNVKFEDGLICGQNASVWLINGDMTIGNNANENFQYESTTIIDIAGNSKLMVAGSLRRRFATSSVDFRLKNNAQIEVMIEGAVTNSSERRAAFDFGEANSLFTMSGNSKVIIYKPMELSPSIEKDPDYLVSATNYNVTGGTVQFGDVLVNPVAPQSFNLIASVPFWNLDITNTHTNDLIVGSPIVTVLNDFTIQSNGIFNQNGNNLNIAGDFKIIGQYKTGSTGTKRVNFFGDTTSTPATKRNQTLMISSINSDAFYDFSISKPDSGTVFLSNSLTYPYSNLLIKNTLEFSVGNRGLIFTGDDRYVQVGTNNSDLASIQRFGKGHVNGFLRRWINFGAQDKLFTVGTKDYTPARIETTSGTGVEGTISVKAYGIEHPDIATSTGVLQEDTHIDRYWQILPLGSSPYSLDAGQSFNLTTYFIKGNVPSGDVKPGTSYGIFEHFRRIPAWDDPLIAWELTVPFERTDSSTTTQNNVSFGDYVIGEIAGERFFSANSGDWNTISTWKMASYTGADATRIPNQETDRVFIGNGKTVTIQNSSPRVRSVTVEVHAGLPGKLNILDERYLRGLSFNIANNCFLSTDDAFGFTAVYGPTPNIGAIRTTSIREFGKATYEYIGSQSQAIGDGPINPKTIIVNNDGTVTNGVSFSPFIYTVEDSIIVQKGGLLIGNGLINLKGQLVVQSNTYVSPNLGTLNLNGTINQFMVMNNSTGVNIYNFSLSKTAGNLFLSGIGDSSSLNIVRNLNFTASNIAYISGRASNKKVVLQYDTTTYTRTGIGHIDGYLLKYTGGDGALSYNFPIGFGSQYMPVTLDITVGTGTAGLIASRVDSPPNTNFARIDASKKINYYWTIAPWTNFMLGSRFANTTFNFPASELANLTGGIPDLAKLKKLAVPTASPGWNQKNYIDLSWNVVAASVNISNPLNYWNGLGVFYIGEVSEPKYYSRQSGLWNDSNTWTYEDTHIGDAVLAGDFPNRFPENTEDDVYIGLDHIVSLNVSEPQIDTLIVRHNSKFDLDVNAINCFNCSPSKGLFALQDNSTIAFGGSNIPSTLTSMKNFKVYTMSSNSTIEYTGTQSIISEPFSPHYTSYPGHLRISGSDIKRVNDYVLVNGNVYVVVGAYLEINSNILNVYGSIYNAGTIFNDNIIELGY